MYVWYGTDIVRRLRASGFKGLLCRASANSASITGPSGTHPYPAEKAVFFRLCGVACFLGIIVYALAPGGVYPHWVGKHSVQGHFLCTPPGCPVPNSLGDRTFNEPPCGYFHPHKEVAVKRTHL